MRRNLAKSNKICLEERRFHDLRWNPIKRFKKNVKTGEYLLDNEKDQPEEAKGIYFNNTFNIL